MRVFYNVFARQLGLSLPAGHTRAVPGFFSSGETVTL